MSFHRRIRTIYWKELVDIMRDRRTLIAMILVPIVLYPLLMLGSIQAVSYQAESLGDESIRVGVLGADAEQRARQVNVLTELLHLEAAALLRDRETSEDQLIEALAEDELPVPLLDRIEEPLGFGTREELQSRIGDRTIHVGIVFKKDALDWEYDTQNDVEVLGDMEEVHSAVAVDRVNLMISRAARLMVDKRKERTKLPEQFDKPFNVKITDLSVPSSILGQILPLILVLMTITGAIYPAIDLTAGERERGTLESLMASPVPVLDLIVGKFLVVTTVAIMGAALNLASVSATVYFGGFDKVIAGAGGGIPLATMGFILLCLIPFAVLMSAIMIAVCSYARTFKEAQNYVTPVILAVLIPGGIAALPTTRLEGIMLVMPVGNMVLLARELLLGALVPWMQVVMVVLSTTLYAGAAVAVAANTFGKESVVFADAGSWKTVFSRALIKPSTTPSISMGLIVVALLFPTWFFVQSALSPREDESAAGILFAAGWSMPILFVLLPIAVLWYWKVDIIQTLALRLPPLRYMLAAILIGVSAWVPAHELNVLQERVFGVPQAVMESAKIIEQALAGLPAAGVLLLIAVIPAICEESLFRGFLLCSMRGATGKWTAIIVSAAVFGVFHFFLFKFAVTTALGIVLGYICWQSRSIIPVMLAHCLHNGLGAMTARNQAWQAWLGLNVEDPWAHLPPQVLIGGGIVFVLGLAVASRNPRLGSGFALRHATEE
ncbi:MAG: CPBP family intramembrane metalloprotease [Phycisphaerales bacterium]|nr:MAG: CPBP family intramembrane metalloprotease [Phycisphaerales bacterium]